MSAIIVFQAHRLTAQQAALLDTEQVSQTARASTTAHIRSSMASLASVATVSILLVFASGAALTTGERRRADRKLKELAQCVVTSREEERARVARELHDGISQLLVSIKYQFELVEQRLASGRGEPIRNLRKELAGLTAAIAEVRRISHALRPALFDHLGLPAVLHHSAREFSQRTGVRVVFNPEPPGAADGGSGLHDLSEEQAVTLFRVAQEALTNVERHAGAASVAITLVSEGNAVRLSIVDDGCGFAGGGAARRNRGIGLRNIRERVEHHGGHLRVSFEPGRTEVSVTLPLLTQPKPVA